MAKKLKITFLITLIIIALRAFLYHAFVNPFGEFRTGSFVFSLLVFLYTFYYYWVNFSSHKAAVIYRMNRHREFTGQDVEVDQLHFGKMEALMLAVFFIFLLLIFTTDYAASY